MASDKAAGKKNTRHKDPKTALEKKGIVCIARRCGGNGTSSDAAPKKLWRNMEAIVGKISGKKVKPCASPDSRGAASSNLLQRLFELRGESMTTLGNELGIGMHSVQKTVKGIRQSSHIRKAIAGYLENQYGVEIVPDDLWSSSRTMRRLIEIEIDCRAEEERDRLNQKYLKNSRRLTDSKALGNV